MKSLQKKYFVGILSYFLMLVSNSNAQPINQVYLFFQTAVSEEIGIGNTDIFGNYKTIEKMQKNKYYQIQNVNNNFILFQSNTSHIPILIHSGDTLEVSVENLSPSIFVRNQQKQAELNFFAELSKRDESIVDFKPKMLASLYPKYKIDKSKLNIDSLFYQGNRFLKSKENVYSQEIYSLYKKIILTYYLDELLSRYLTNRIGYASIESLIEQHRTFFQESEMLSYSIYRTMLYKYVQTLQKNRNAQDLQTIISEYFAGNMKSHLLFDILRKMDKQSIHFPEYLAKFYAECTDPELLQYVRENLDTQGLQIDTRQVQVIKASALKDAISWQSVLDQYKGKVVYVDFWASWCSPCIAEFPAEERLKQAYSGKDVVFVYVSIDEDVGAWRSTAQSHGLGNYAHSYLLLNQETSPLNRQINYGQIPRYVIYDKQGRLLDKDAPRPSEAAVRQKLDAALRQ